MKNTIVAAFLCLAAISQIQGCKSAQAAFPEGSDKAVFDQYDVQGRRDFSLFSGKFKFGPYSVDWTRGATTGDGSRSSSFFKSEESDIVREKYTVALTGADGASWKGECKSEAEYQKNETKIGNVKTASKETLDNTLVSKLISSDRQIIELKISQDSGFNSRKSGTVQGKNISFEIKATYRLEGAAWDIPNVAGYYITESGTLVAVVDVSNEGKVYIVKGLKKEKTQLLAAVSAVLLGYKDVLN